MLECDLKLEMAAIPDLKDAIAYAEDVRDYVSRDLFQEILEDEEEHVDWLETQLNRQNQNNPCYLERATKPSTFSIKVIRVSVLCTLGLRVVRTFVRRHLLCWLAR